MNAKLLKRWTTALRSGKYKKGKDALRIKAKNGDKFCCLGVLCDIVAPNAWDEEYDGLDMGQWVFHNKAQDSHLICALSDELGITLDQQKELAILNDKGRKGFGYIASKIEKMFS
jgi:hypothetical protein